MASSINVLAAASTVLASASRKRFEAAFRSRRRLAVLGLATALISDSSRSVSWVAWVTFALANRVAV